MSRTREELGDLVLRAFDALDSESEERAEVEDAVLLLEMKDDDPEYGLITRIRMFSTSERPVIQRGIIDMAQESEDWSMEEDPEE